MNTSAKKLNKALIISAIFIVFLLVIIKVGFSEHRNSHINLDIKCTKVEQCKLIEENGNETTFLIPSFISSYDKFRLKLDISKYKEINHSFVSLLLSYSELNAYADGELIYTRKIPKWSLVKSGASKIVSFEIPNNIKDSYIILEITPKIHYLAYRPISKLYIGDESEFVIHEIVYEFPIIMACVSLIIVFLVIAFSKTHREVLFKNREYNVIYVSMFGVVVSLYLLTQLWSIQYVFSAFNITIYFIEYTTLALMTIPPMMIAKENYSIKMSLVIDCYIVVALGNIINQYILIFFRVREFKEFLVVDHIMMCLAAVIIFITFLITDESIYKGKKEFRFFTYITCISFLFPPLYYFMYTNSMVHKIVICCILIVVFAEIRRILNNFKMIDNENMRSRIFREMAFMDPLTYLPNRRAYQDFSTSIMKNKTSGWILSIDLNGLKYVNDTFGHNVGDEMIKSFAKVLRRESAKNKNVNSFRLGGDEFLVFMKKDDNSDVDALVATINDGFDFRVESNESFVANASIGYSYYDPETKDLGEVYWEADYNMYEVKKDYKRNKETVVYNKN